MIDYMRDRFYFFPYDQDVVDMGGAPKTWNVSVLPANDRFEVTGIWKSLEGQVEFGDQVININGTDLKNFPLSQPEVDKVFDAIEGDEAYIIVLKGGKEKTVKIRKE